MSTTIFGDQIIIIPHSTEATCKIIHARPYLCSYILAHLPTFSTLQMQTDALYLHEMSCILHCEAQKLKRRVEWGNERGLKVFVEK